MMRELTIRQIIRWSGARLMRGKDSCLQASVRGISCDSRQLQPGALFIALRGDRFDGHAFVGRSLEQGAGAVLIDNPQTIAELEADERYKAMLAGGDRPVLLVDQCLKALQDIAAGYRLELQGTVIAVTGSVGKTSTRQMIASCLSPVLQVHQSEGNLNNEIGLPQTLLSADQTAEAVVLEMGMRGPGEIALLSCIAKPDIAIITCIGWSHIGRLGSQEAILDAKWEIVSGLRPGGLLVINGDDPLLMQKAASLTCDCRLAVICATDQGLAAARSLPRPVACILSAHDITVTASQTAFSVTCQVSGQPDGEAPVYVALPFPGHHHVRNALFGFCAAWALQLDLAVAAAGAAVCGIVGNRQRIIQAGGITLMDDSYNASPESMAAALESLSLLAGGSGRKLAALGCMLELGPFAPEAHRQVGELVALHGFSLLLVFGAEAEDVLIGARTAAPELPSCSCTSQAEIADRLAAVLQPGDYLLIKGSRAYAMEQVTERLLALLAQPGSGVQSDDRN